MTVIHHHNIEQRSEEWYAARCGLLTASEMKLIITPGKLQAASNSDERAHLYELLAQRATHYVEPNFVSYDMQRGQVEELRAKIIYNDKYAPLANCGFITNDKFGFTLGYSPDGLVGDDGQIECKSRKQKYQVETILCNAMPDEFKIQVQTGLLVSERKWCDFISYCGGMPMLVLRVEPDPVIQEAIIACAAAFHEKLENRLEAYRNRLEDKNSRLTATERIIEEEMHL